MAYIPPLNGGRINVSITGNTAGASYSGGVQSTGTFVLAGGNNITLSQSTNTNGATVSLNAAYAGGNNTFGMSDLGNTSGTSGVISGGAGRFLFAGGNNVTLSQSIDASSATITISAASQSVQTQSNIQGIIADGSSNNTGAISFANSNGVSFGLSNNTLTASISASQSNQSLGFIAGNNTSLTSTGTLDARSMYVNGLGGVSAGFSNNSAFLSAPVVSSVSATGILSISTNGDTVSMGAPAYSIGLATNGNSSGNSGSATNQFVLAGGSNITLSQVTGTGGNTMSIIGASGGGGGGGGVAISAPGSSYTSGTVNIVNGGGALTITGTSNSISFAVPSISSIAGLNGVTVSTSGNTISIYGPGDTASTNDFYQNMDRGTSAALAVPFNSTGGATLMLQRLNQENDHFPANITANTVLMNMSGSGSSNSSSAHTVTAYIGIYSDNVSQLNLINSASSSWSLSANTSNSSNYLGPRWMSFESSQWSSMPVFQQGAEYVFGVFMRASGMSIPLSYIGQNYMGSQGRSGTLGQSKVANATLAAGNYWNATYSAAVTAFPTAISSNQVTRSGASAIFMPHLVLNNRYSGTM